MTALPDLGCGRGFCAIDQADLHGLNIELQHSTFDDVQIAPQSPDGVFCSWALAWVPHPEAHMICPVVMNIVLDL